MNEYNNERLSALIDGEQVNNHTDKLDRLINDRDMKDTWSRYHLIGDCLRDHIPEKISSHVSTKVSNTLRDEPTVLAPQATKRFSLKPITGFAIAASVAMVAVFSVQHNNEVNSSSNVTTIAANHINTAVLLPDSYSFLDTQVLPAAVKKSDTLYPVENQRLNNYLLNHNEYRSNGGMNGIPPYVRIVTIDSRGQ